MNASERPRQFGSDEDRLLAERLAAVPLPVPEELRRRARRAVEERLFTRSRRAGPLALVLVASSLAGSALAYSLVKHRTSSQILPAPSPISRPSAPQIRPLAAAAPAPAPPPAPRPRRVALTRAPGPIAPPSPGGTPAWPLAETEEPLEEAGPAPQAPRLLISRESEGEVSLVLAGERVVGRVRGTPVALTLERTQLGGKLGHRNVSLWLQGAEARGEIGGIPVKMQLVPTRDGHQLREGFSVRPSLPFPATRVELTATSLSWSPGCDAALTRTAAGVYEGRCASGRQARVVIPPSWQRLPTLTRLILLSFFLTERDPALARLFGPSN